MKSTVQAGPVFPSPVPTQHVLHITPLEVGPSGLNLIPRLSWALQAICAGVCASKLSVPESNPESWRQLAWSSGLLRLADISRVGTPPASRAGGCTQAAPGLGPHPTRCGSPGGEASALRLGTLQLVENKNCNPWPRVFLSTASLTGIDVALFNVCLIFSKERNKYKSLSQIHNASFTFLRDG